MKWNNDNESNYSICFTNQYYIKPITMIIVQSEFDNRYNVSEINVIIDNDENNKKSYSVEKYKTQIDLYNVKKTIKISNKSIVPGKYPQENYESTWNLYEIELYSGKQKLDINNIKVSDMDFKKNYINDNNLNTYWNSSIYKYDLDGIPNSNVEDLQWIQFDITFIPNSEEKSVKYWLVKPIELHTYGSSYFELDELKNKNKNTHIQEINLDYLPFGNYVFIANAPQKSTFEALENKDIEYDLNTSYLSNNYFVFEKTEIILNQDIP